MSLTEQDREVMSALGGRVRAKRLELDLTQKTLAGSAGISLSFLCEVESGKRGIGVVRCLRLAEALSVRVEWLMTGESAAEELERLRALINTPHTSEFLEAVRIEAAHQRGDKHDDSKAPEDWFWTVGYLLGKAIRPSAVGVKRLQYIITTAALLLNWHRRESP